MKRINISSGAPWEAKVGYSRAVRIGNQVVVSGTTAMDGDRVVGEGSAYEQTKFILEKIGRALAEAGSRFEDVIRTRIYITDMAYAEEVGKAHGEVFAEIRPAATMVAVSALILPALVVEIEVDAIVSPA